MFVYRIYNLSDECYIGSTTQNLKRRWYSHKAEYKRWKAGKSNKCRSYELFDKYGAANCFYELLETVEDESQLKFRERFWIQFYGDNAVNKVSRPIITEEERKEHWKKNGKEYRVNNLEHILKRNKEYYKNNQEQILKQKKEYHKNNREEILKQMKEYRQNNREEILKQKKEYYKNNREQITKKHKEYYENNREQILEPYTCECGSTITKIHKLRHNRTIKHKTFIQNKQ